MKSSTGKTQKNSTPQGSAPLLPTSPVPASSYVTYFGLAMLGCAIDLASKEMVFHWRGLPQQNPEWWLIEGYVGIETSLNRGALFGLGAGYSWLFAVLSVTAIIGIMLWLFTFKAGHDRFFTITLGCITGGILGNLYDRLGLWNSGYFGATPLPQIQDDYRYAVRDWILFRYQTHTWPNFNIADSLLVCGAFMLAWHSFMYREPDEGK